MAVVKRRKKPRCPTTGNVKVFCRRLGPWGAKRTKPAQSRAIFMISVLRWQARGGVYCPPPSPRGLPPSIQSGWVCSLRSTSFRSGRKPFINRSKGGDSPRPVAGGREEEKNANVHVCIFFCSGRRPAAPAPGLPQWGVLCPPSLAASHLAHRASPHGRAQMITLFPKLRNERSPRIRPPDRKRTGGGLPK